MLLLSAPFDSAAGVRPRLPARPYVQVGAATALLVAGSMSLEVLGAPLGGLGRAVAGGAIHAGLFALGWLVVTGAASGWAAPATRVGAALVVASVAGRLGPWGPLAYLAVPVVLLLEARGRAAIRAMGFAGARASHALAGLGAGGFIGAHLLITSSLTFGYRVHTSSVGAYLALLAYDVGANVLSAEWLFHGALFSVWWRRWSFWPAAALTTALAVLRYQLDPALPHATEARAGAVLYLGLLGLTGCALRAWSGSLLPGYLAALGFFAAYRVLTP